MSNSMSNSKIKEIVVNYLDSKNICFHKKHEKDVCSIYIKKLDNIFYIESHNSYYIKTLQPHDYGYPEQAGGYPVDSYKNFPSYRFVCDDKGNIIVDLAEIKNDPFNRNVKWLDKENIFLPIKGDKHDNWQHYRIKNGKAKLINTFSFVDFIDEDEHLLKNKLIVCDGKLYNFEKGIISCDVFDGFLTNKKKDLKKIAAEWDIPSYEQQEEFVELISQKIKDKNLLIGYKKIQVKKDDISLKYFVCVFIDKDGNFVSNLYYVNDDYNYVSIDNITPKNFEFVIQQLNDILVSKVDSIIFEREKKEETKRQILQQIRENLF